MKTQYTVWVGGGEVNDFLIETKEKAQSIAESWIAEGYDDAVVEAVITCGDCLRPLSECQHKEEYP